MQRPMEVWMMDKTTDGKTDRKQRKRQTADRQTQTDQWTQGYINRQKDGPIRQVN